MGHKRIAFRVFSGILDSVRTDCLHSGTMPDWMKCILISFLGQPSKPSCSGSWFGTRLKVTVRIVMVVDFSLGSASLSLRTMVTALLFQIDFQLRSLPLHTMFFAILRNIMLQLVFDRDCSM